MEREETDPGEFKRSVSLSCGCRFKYKHPRFSWISGIKNQEEGYKLTSKCGVDGCIVPDVPQGQSISVSRVVSLESN